VARALPGCAASVLPLLWHYQSMSSRSAKIVAIALMTLIGAGPAVATSTSTSLTTGISTSASSTPQPSSSGSGDDTPRPNVGDDAPGGHDFGERRNILTDESGLIALGLAAVLGVATAILVVRNRRKNSLY
jgi:hypothetical protein